MSPTIHPTAGSPTAGSPTAAEPTRRLPRRLFLAGTAAAGAAGLAACAGQPGVTAPVGLATQPSPPVHDVVLGASDITAPATVPAGPVRLQVTSPGQRGRALLIVAMRPGFSIDDFLARLAATSSYDPAARAEAAVRLYEAAVQLGGGAVTAEQGVGVTALLPPGTFHLINFNYASATEVPPYAELTVDDSPGVAFPAVDDVVLHTHPGGDDWGFHVPSDTLAASGAHLVVNTTDATHELMLAPVRPGTTTEQVEAYYAQMSTGTPPPQDQSPLLGWPQGLGAMTGGRSAVFHTDFAPGEYLMFSYITNEQTGFPRAYEGMFRLTRLV